jgi:FeS assembly SUF system protein
MTDSPVQKIQDDVKRAEIIEALRKIYDPEIPVNIYDMGLIYDIRLDASGDVHVQMTLTSPACPVAETLPAEVKSKVESLDSVRRAQVEIVWDPPWTPDNLSEEAKLELGLL